MSKVCDICGKGSLAGNNVSHSNRKTRKVAKANLQEKRVVSAGVSKRILVCSKCIKNMGK